jgi:acetylornithine deacetylase/succinyl-diaminopimelate desuccinylase-like protein
MLPAMVFAAALTSGGVAASPDRGALKANVEKLVSFGTRHSLSSATDPKRGISAARAWAASRLAALGKACGGCVVVEQPARRFEGKRALAGVNIADVLGIQKGREGSNDIVIVSGHIDSRVSDPFDATSDAPGANDDGSGVALVLEAARLLSKETHRATIIYAVLSGEEQGLWGGELLAETAKARGWNVLAVLNNDIVGNTVGTDGRVVADRVRVFSEGIRASEDSAAHSIRRGDGGEDDGPSRALAKAIVRIATSDLALGVEPVLIRRPDRLSRGGDHLPMLEAGFPAVRFTVGVENYDAQHQNVRTVGGRAYGDTADRMDFDYLGKVTAINIAVLRELANAPPPPVSASLSGAVSVDTEVRWTKVADATGYRVHWRRADGQRWTAIRDVSGDQTALKLPGVNIDDNFFGVSALGTGGQESLVTFAGEAR